MSDFVLTFTLVTLGFYVGGLLAKSEEREIIKQGSDIVIDGNVYQCKQVDLGGGE